MMEKPNISLDDVKNEATATWKCKKKENCEFEIFWGLAGYERKEHFTGDL